MNGQHQDIMWDGPAGQRRASGCNGQTSASIREHLPNGRPATEPVRPRPAPQAGVAGSRANVLLLPVLTIILVTPSRGYHER